jgi:hypothetical protein
MFWCLIEGHQSSPCSTSPQALSSIHQQPTSQSGAYATHCGALSKQKTGLYGSAISKSFLKGIISALHWHTALIRYVSGTPTNGSREYYIRVFIGVFYAEAGEGEQCGQFFSNRCRYRFQSGFYVQPYVDIAENPSDFYAERERPARQWTQHAETAHARPFPVRTNIFILPYRTRKYMIRVGSLCLSFAPAVCLSKVISTCDCLLFALRWIFCLWSCVIYWYYS